MRWTDEAITGLDAMFRLRVFERDEFLAGIRRFRGMRWVRTLRAIGPLADPRSESPPESVLRLRCIELGLTDVEPQVEVWDDGGFVARLDLAERRRRFAFEYDGAQWHSDPDDRARDASRREHAADVGWLLEVFRAEDVFGRGAECERRHAGPRPRRRDPLAQRRSPTAPAPIGQPATDRAHSADSANHTRRLAQPRTPSRRAIGADSAFEW